MYSTKVNAVKWWVEISKRNVATCAKHQKKFVKVWDTHFNLTLSFVYKEKMLISLR